MVCFRELRLKEEYRSNVDDLVADFYIPCLRAARSYDRAVGYFTSAGLALGARGFEAFLDNGATVRLVASPQLTEEDLSAIERGLRARDEVVERRLLDALAATSSPSDNVLYLAWLVARGRLDIRLAIPTRRPGIYHEKVGVLSDADGCRVAFAGSANETAGGLVNNFESIDVFFSWDESRGRVTRKATNFEALWAGHTAELEIMTVPDAVHRHLVQLAAAHGAQITAPTTPRPRAGVEPPEGVSLRDYQEQAKAAWLRADGRGILSMATGSGKTKTALAAVAVLLRNQPRPPAIVVVVPYIHLVDQWADECIEWGLKPIRCYESAGRWLPILTEAIDTAAVVDSRPICVVTTLATAGGGKFKRCLRAILEHPTILVADEVHHLGANGAADLLDPRYRWRLGLSATPKRWNDELGTEIVDSYFGGIVFEFSLAEAIAAGRLSPYRYEPVLVDLDREELTEYRRLMDDIEDLALDPETKRSPEMRHLLNQRSVILNGAAGKAATVATLVMGRRLSHTLFYCSSRLQMGAVSDVLRDLGIVPRPFTAEEDRATRAEVLGSFEAGRVPAIVAMRALDEGVDIPDTREAHLLASSGNPREFVQRRGRILRLAVGKTSATLYDYVVVPHGQGHYERDIARREMERVLEFAQSSLNPDVARQRVWPILDAFDLIHLVGGF
jgi:superfamily II DNA or RNA helicase